MIYFIEAVGADAVKVGYTHDEAGLAARLVNLQIGNHCDLQVVHTREGTRDAEKALHREFAAFKLRGEWFTRAVLDRLGAQGSNKHIIACPQCGRTRRHRRIRQERKGTLCRSCSTTRRNRATATLRPALVCAACAVPVSSTQTNLDRAPADRRCRSCAMREAWASRGAVYEARRAVSRAITLEARRERKQALKQSLAA